MSYGHLLRAEMLIGARAPRLYFLRSGAAAMFAAFAAFAWPWGEAAWLSEGQGARVFTTVLSIQLLAAGLLTPLIFAPIFPAERDSGRLDVIRLVSRSEHAIIETKLAWGMILIASILVAALPVSLACFALGGVTMEQILIANAGVFVTALFSAATAIRASAMSNTTGWAVWWSYFLLAVVAFGGGLLAALLNGFTAGRTAWAYATFLPWWTFADDALALRDIPWAQRFASWSWLIGLSAFMLKGAGVTLKQSLERFAARPDRDLALRWGGERISRPVIHTRMTPKQRGAVGLRPIRWWNLLPVWSNPILWKEVMLSARPSIQGFAGVGLVIGGLGIALATVSVFTDRPLCAGFLSFFIPAQTLILTLFLTQYGASTFAEERHQGTLPILLSTGFPPSQIIAGKLAGVLHPLRPQFAMLVIQLCIGVAAIGYPAFLIACVIAVSAAVAIAVATALSFFMRSPNHALVASLAVLFCLWFGPSLSADLVRDPPRVLVQLNPILLMRELFFLRPPRTFDASGFLAFLGVSGVVVTLCHAVTLGRLDKAVRA